MSKEDDDLTIKDLERFTHFTARSIHHYISRGLLPGPEGSGPAARYSKEHLLRLKLIERAKAANFRIDQRLQDALAGLSEEELEEMAELAEGASPEDIKLFGQWLVTGEWGREARPQPKVRLKERMPSTAALLESQEPVDFAFSGVDHAPEPRPRPERWERQRFGSRLEVSWRQPQKSPGFREKVQELLRLAERLFGQPGNDL